MALFKKKKEEELPPIPEPEEFADLPPLPPLFAIVPLFVRVPVQNIL
jgi:hypothetical protein